MKQYIENYLREMITILDQMLKTQVGIIEKMVYILKDVKERGGRVFFVGVGGGAGTGSHATNDFMKIAGIPAISLTDNVSLLTALANDEGFETVFTRQMEMHRFDSNDCVFIFSVGGGSDTTSKNITNALIMASELGAPILGVVGRNTGYAFIMGDAVLVVPNVAEARVTPHSESFQLALDHLLVNALAREGE